MPKFRQKPLTVEAIQWWPGMRIDGVILEGDKNAPVFATDEFGRHYPFNSHWGAIRTLEGFMFVSPGDWIITGVKGEKYPCKPDIFAEAYEEVPVLPTEGKAR